MRRRRSGCRTGTSPPPRAFPPEFPMARSVTSDLLKRIELAEEFLHSLGFHELRARHHGDVVRVEVPESELESAMRQREAITGGLRALGWAYVTLDLDGLRHGSLNETLRPGAKTSARIVHGMNADTLRALLQEVADGAASPEAAFEKLRTLPFTEAAQTLADTHREIRVGLPEVVYGRHKTAEQIAEALDALKQAHGHALATHVAGGGGRNPRPAVPGGGARPVSWFFSIGRMPSRISRQAWPWFAPEPPTCPSPRRPRRPSNLQVRRCGACAMSVSRACIVCWRSSSRFEKAASSSPSPAWRGRCPESSRGW